MWPVSDAFLAGCRAGNQRVTARAELWVDDAKAVDVTIVSGQVSVERTRDIRRTLPACTLLDVDATLTPNDAHDLLAPTGTQLRAWRGLVLPDGTLEEVPLGVFRIVNPKISLSGDGQVTIELTGEDESATVKAARPVATLTYPRGGDVATTLAAVISACHPYLPVSAEAPIRRLQAPLVIAAGADSDPWAQVQAVAAAYGLDVAVDATGTCVIQPLPAPNRPAAMTCRADSEAVITRLSRALTAEQTYSGVCVRGEPPDAAPVQAVVWDNDAESPTYAQGRFGRKPYFITSQLIATEDQAQATAQEWLPQVTGVMEAVEFEQVVNPALDVGDVIRVVNETARLDAHLTVDTLAIPLEPSGVMTCVARSRALSETEAP